MGFFHCTGTRQSDNRPAMKLIPALVPICALVSVSYTHLELQYTHRSFAIGSMEATMEASVQN